MKRENIRRTVITISAFLMPLTIYFISPVVILMAASEGIINSSAMIFFILFIASLFIGRIWCGWLCPTGGSAGRSRRRKQEEGIRRMEGLYQVRILHTMDNADILVIYRSRWN